MAERSRIGKMVAWAISWTCLVGSAAGSQAADRVDYDRDVRPILAENCYACHGPDGNARKGELRLDRKADAFKASEKGFTIVPGNVDSSELIQRIIEEDPESRMPPPKSGKALTKAQIETLRRWVAEGAEWRGHWAFLPPKRPNLPEVNQTGWARNPIDAFILKDLEARGLKPAPEADKVALIRRLSLDLTGLPPSIAEADAFVKDNRPEAYDTVVDRLLASPAYGERMTQHWLDAARYGDTNGYHIDNHRDIWKYREWVINAYNRNMPFDRFTVEQMAGDLLPDATIDQKIASGFHRNTMVNFEGGADAEEYLTKYLGDRVATTGTVFLGVTMACAECHDHKFDPFTQKDFYRFYAFFNGIAEEGLDGRIESPAPRMKVPSVEQSARLADLHGQVAKLNAQLDTLAPDAEKAQAEWERTRGETESIWTVLEPSSLKSSGGSTLSKLTDRSILASGKNPDKDVYEFVASTKLTNIHGIRLEALTHESFAKGTGRADNSNFVLTGVEVATASAAKPNAWSPVPLGRAEADYYQMGGDFRVEKAIDADPTSGWAVDGPTRRLDCRAVFVAKAPFGTDAGTRIRVRLHFESPFVRHAIGRFRLAITSDENPGLGTPSPQIVEALATAPLKRSEAQSKELRDYFRKEVWPQGRKIRRELESLAKLEAEVDRSIPVTMVMAEMVQPRPTHILIRGDFRSKGPVVAAGVPESLPPLPAGQPSNRLGLARWLVDPGNPLVARVTVNRFWQQYFGVGIVKTANDFGTQGEWPSHPELLDWLATEFVATSWDVKAIQKLIVMSATYRQDSKVEKSLIEIDPENRLLARGPRFRLDAEAIRDNALAISGLLDPRVGGPSIYPYQPPGLWEEISFGAEFSSQKYIPSHGNDLYRRGLYTYWKRSLLHPSLATFDAPSREVCAVQRPRTNTPLQALVLLNDPIYVEAARVLAQRVLKEAGPDDQARMVHAFRLCVARTPTDRERAVLMGLLARQRNHFQADPKAAKALISAGESPQINGLDPAELAAWTAIGNLLLNLDETITKG